MHFACRDVQAAQTAIQAVPQKSMAFPLHLDMEDESSIVHAAAKVAEQCPQGIDVLVNNAGFAFSNDSTVPFGIQAEKTNKINYFGTSSVCANFIPLLKAGGRIVNLSSRAGLLEIFRSDALRKQFAEANSIAAIDQLIHRFMVAAKDADVLNREGWPETAYGTSKAAITALTKVLSVDPRLTSRGITVYACCPGWCRTDMTHGEGYHTAEEGADTPFWLATAPEVAKLTGQFFAERAPTKW